MPACPSWCCSATTWISIRAGAPRLANCRAFITAANAAGGKAEILVLPEIGIKGNTHMLMQDNNSLDIADILLDWIGKHVTGEH